MSIVVLGTVALDTVETPSGKRKNMLGGSAAHFAMSARFFSKVNLVAVVGEDFPQAHLDFLRGKGIGLGSLSRNQGRTFRWQGKYAGDLNTALTLNTELGVLSAFKPVVSKAQRKIKHIFLANVDPDIQMYLLRQMYSPGLVGLDSMNYWIEHKRKSLLRVLSKAGIYVVNDQEARSLSGEKNLIRAAKCLQALGPKMILIKKGEHGTICYSKNFIFCLPAYPVDKVIDPTGAGDTFAGGFFGYLARANKLGPAAIKKAIAYGTVAASFNVEGFGLERAACLKSRDLEERLVKFRKIVLF